MAKKSKKSAFPEIRWTNWVDYIGLIRNELWLGHWRINLSHDPLGGSNTVASIVATYGRRIATVSLCEEWETFTPEQHRHYVAHELLHLKVLGMQMVMNRAADVFGDQATLTAEFHMEQLEYCVDDLATIVSPFLSLPPEAETMPGVVGVPQRYASEIDTREPWVYSASAG